MLPNLLTTCQNQHIAGCVPYPAFNVGALSQNVWLASNIYHSLQITATKHFSNGLSFLMAYTWNKNIDDGYNGYREPVADRMLDRALDPNTVPRSFTLSYDYYLPFGPGRKWATSGPLVPILGGWQFGGILSLQRRFPAERYYKLLLPMRRRGQPAEPNWPGRALRLYPEPANTGSTLRTSLLSRFMALGRKTMGPSWGPGCRNINISLSKRFYFPKTWRGQESTVSGRLL